MLDTFDDIKNNGIVNHFKEIAESYGLYGTYVNWQPGGLNEGGIYFVCGLDKEKIAGRNLDMFQILEKQRRDRGYIHADARAFKVNGKHPLMLHCSLVDHCQTLSAISKVYNYVGQPVPEKVSSGIAETMKMTWENFTDETKSAKVKSGYEKMLFHAVKTEMGETNMKSSKRKLEAYIESGFYDSGRGRLYNWFKRHFAKYKNEVSLSHLVAHAGRICSSKILYKNYNTVKTELQKCPDVLYSFSKERGRVLNVADSEGFGSKENNDRRFFTLYYPSYASKDVEEIIQKVNFPTEFNRTLNEVDPKGYGTEHLVIPVKYFDMFKSDCDKYGVKFCIDKTALDTVAGGVAVAFSAADSERVYRTLNAIVDVSETYQMKDVDRKQIAQERGSIDDAVGNLKRNGFVEITPSSFKSYTEEER